MTLDAALTRLVPQRQPEIGCAQCRTSVRALNNVWWKSPYTGSCVADYSDIGHQASVLCVP